MSLYVASHYKNQPNDLQLLSDAPAHHLFVLCPPISQNQTSLPMPLVVLQIALEGRISKESISSGEVFELLRNEISAFPRDFSIKNQAKLLDKVTNDLVI